MDDYYNIFKDIRKTGICPKYIKKFYGSHAAFTLNYKTGIVVKKGGLALDVLAMDIGFESADALHEALMNYYPKWKWHQDLKHYEGDDHMVM